MAKQQSIVTELDPVTTDTLPEEGDEREQLRAEIERLQRENADLVSSQKHQKIAYGCMLATVPGRTVEVKIARPDRPHPQDDLYRVSQVEQHYLQEGDMLSEYHADGRGVVVPISPQRMKLAAENEQYLIHNGVVFWDEAHESLEQAELRGLRNFITHCMEMRQNIRERLTDLRKAGQEKSLPKDAAEEQYMFPTETSLEITYQDARKKAMELATKLGVKL
uniref:Uncharacterized protein n=1 Tax=viral metagenome TaxID=1070528 RepID=A0A6M3JYE4_9ZZZZ